MLIKSWFLFVQASCDWNEDAGFDRQSHEADLFEQEMDAELQSRAFTAEVNSGLSKGDRSGSAVTPKLNSMGTDFHSFVVCKI